MPARNCIITYKMKERERGRRRRRCHAPPRYRRGLSHETNAGERWANMSQTTEEGWRVAAMDCWYSNRPIPPQMPSRPRSPAPLGALQTPKPVRHGAVSAQNRRRRAPRPSGEARQVSCEHKRQLMASAKASGSKRAALHCQRPQARGRG